MGSFPRCVCVPGIAKLIAPTLVSPLAPGIPKMFASRYCFYAVAFFLLIEAISSPTADDD